MPFSVTRWIRDHALGLALFAMFLASVSLQVVFGLAESNEDRLAHGLAQRDISSYLTSGHFVEAIFENWESEFLQMAVFVLLTVILRHRGSPESKDPDRPAPQDEDPRQVAVAPDAPWPVKRGGLVLRLYENSLAIALVGLFVLSFALHAIGGASEYSDQQLAHGQSGVSAVEYLATPRFWFEAMQNWQSEFLSLAVLIVLSVYLRQRGSAESKPVHASHAATGQA
jgi:hypothetical protein